MAYKSNTIYHYYHQAAKEEAGCRAATGEEEKGEAPGDCSPQQYSRSRYSPS
jgi:hypothetical protein